jgi:type II secretory pathway pseudopilin PulG
MSVAILAILAAVVAPSVASTMDRRRALAAAKTLGQITDGIIAFETAVHSTSTSTTNNYPGDVSQLSIVVRPTLDQNTCNGAMTAHDSTDWVANGPFVPMYIPTTGLWTPIGRIIDTIPTRTATGPLYILISGVDSADAVNLHLVVDHGSGDTISAVRAFINDTTTVTYRALSAGQVIHKC